MNRSNTIPLLAALSVGAALGALLTTIFVHKERIEKGSEKRPLYWVAPMDANYRRDTPGKSPMGMDLVPVYDDADSGTEAGPGTIRISPTVINNLGVRTALVERKTLNNTISTVAYVKFDEDKLIHIHPRVSGWVEKLYVKATGDPVTKGAPLYSLYSPELVNAQEELILALNRNNTRLIQAAEDRLHALQIPPAFINRLKRSKRIQQTITFFVPQDGVVDNLNIREGFFVKPGTTMFSIGALDQVWVEAEVFERQASQVTAGAKVTMSLDYLPGVTWKGRVDYIYPTLDGETRSARVRMRFDNHQNQLKPNMFAQVIIHSNNNEQALLIPREALIRTGAQDRVVLALGEGRFKSIDVQVGREDQQHIEVLKGLKEGENVVSSAQFLLDSESSKTSDFKRMHDEKKKSTSAWVAGVIENQMRNKRLLSIRHEAIEEWNMSAMTMNFKVSDDVDIKPLTPGTELHMEITRNDQGMYEITGTHIMSQGKASKEDESNNSAPMDHPKMHHEIRPHSEHKHSSGKGE